MAFFFGGSGIRNAGLEGASDETLPCAGCSETGLPSLSAELSESMLTMYSPPRCCLHTPAAQQEKHSTRCMGPHITSWALQAPNNSVHVYLSHDTLRPCGSQYL